MNDRDFEQREIASLQLLRRSLENWASTPEQKKRVERALKMAETISQQLIDERDWSVGVSKFLT